VAYRARHEQAVERGTDETAESRKGMRMNEVNLIGNVGRDAEIAYPNGTEVCKFSLATSKKIREETRTEWHNIVAFKQLASECVEIARKGRRLFIRGELETSSWEGKDGQKRSRTEIVARMVIPIASNRTTPGPDQTGGPIASAADATAGGEWQPNNPSITDDDIPF